MKADLETWSWFGFTKFTKPLLLASWRDVNRTIVKLRRDFCPDFEMLHFRHSVALRRMILHLHFLHAIALLYPLFDPQLPAPAQPAQPHRVHDCGDSCCHGFLRACSWRSKAGRCVALGLTLRLHASEGLPGRTVCASLQIEWNAKELVIGPYLDGGAEAVSLAKCRLPVLRRCHECGKTGYPSCRGQSRPREGGAGPETLWGKHEVARKEGAGR